MDASAASGDSAIADCSVDADVAIQFLKDEKSADQLGIDQSESKHEGETYVWYN